MRALLPEPDGDVDLYEHYSRGWVNGGGIRANMIGSADGSAASGGLSAGLQTPGDNRVFATLRDLADVILVGSATAHTEGYRPVSLAGERLARRLEHSFRAQLPVAVITRSLRIDLASPLFADPLHRPLVITCASSDPTGRAALEARADVVVCGADDIDYRAVRLALAERGLPRVLCEGGPTILGQVALCGELDELCLSMTPLLIGPGAGRIVAGGRPWPSGPRRMRLRGVLEEDGALFLRYARR